MYIVLVNNGISRQDEIQLKYIFNNQSISSIHGVTRQESNYGSHHNENKTESLRHFERHSCTCTLCLSSYEFSIKFVSIQNIAYSGQCSEMLYGGAVLMREITSTLN